MTTKGRTGNIDPLGDLEQMRELTANNRRELLSAILALQGQEDLEERSKTLQGVIDRFQKALFSLQKLEDELEKRGVLLRRGGSTGVDRDAARTEILRRLDRFRTQS